MVFKKAGKQKKSKQRTTPQTIKTAAGIDIVMLGIKMFMMYIITWMNYLVLYTKLLVFI